MSSLAHWIEAGNLQRPTAPALLAPNGRWTYAELAEEARRGAAFLRSQGLASGNIAAIAGGACELAMAALACSAARLALLPLDPLTADARWPALLALGGAGTKRLLPLPTELPASADLPDRSAAPSAIALVIATSGSTGTPKAVMLTPANLDAAASASNERLPLAAGDIWLDCLPLHHIGGISILYRCARAGATVLLHEGFDAAAVWRDLQHQPVTHISLVPAMLARLLDCANGSAPPASLRYALLGGAALSRPLFERALATGWPICPTWGMSECAAQAATLLQPTTNWREGEVGTLLSGFELRIDDTLGIALRGPQVMAGYLNPRQVPGLGLDNGWLTTADLGRIDSAGQLCLLGRADDMLISGGVKVHPLEVESCLAACPGVADVAVTALVDPVWGDSLVALIVGTADAEAIRDWSCKHLASAQRPRRVLRIERLPRNLLGKLERSALRDLAREAA
jgi:O-succinylbenzoic acid--CoA ligase